jgi:hypothetical protein
MNNTSAGESLWAEVEVSEHRLRLVCVETGFGVAVNVYSYKDAQWMGVPRWYSTVGQGRLAAENLAQALLTAIGRLQLPTVNWKTTASAAGA